MQETEASAVLFEYCVSRQSFTGEDVPMEEAKASPGDAAPRRPGMAEADASERDSPQAAEDSANRVNKSWRTPSATCLAWPKKCRCFFFAEAHSTTFMIVKILRSR